MKEIQLSRGFVALVDDADYDYLNQWKWLVIFKKRKWSLTHYAIRYEKRGGKKIMIHMHRVILNPPIGLICDHKDRNGLNNQRDNLRVCTIAQNNMNKRSVGKSKYLGVHYFANRFTAQICMDGKQYRIGRFKTEKEAALAYDEVAKIHHGEFANLNFPLK